MRSKQEPALVAYYPSKTAVNDDGDSFRQGRITPVCIPTPHQSTYNRRSPLSLIRIAPRAADAAGAVARCRPPQTSKATESRTVTSTSSSARPRFPSPHVRMWPSCDAMNGGEKRTCSWRSCTAPRTVPAMAKRC
jgi:hypothetical protein